MHSTRRQFRRYPTPNLSIQDKANRILNLILFAIVLILIRLWHLSIVQYEERSEEARRPRVRTVVEPARRATIRDRFNIPLATNRVQYQAAVFYSQLREIPSISWEKDSLGKKIKRFKRKEYITSLANCLAEELHLDAERLEDLIHSKASYYYQVPFIVKEDITEKEYYRLKILERDWPGIHVQRVPKRCYPLGRTAADIIGYMGAINKSQYDAIIHEIKTLEKYVKEREAGDEPPLPQGLTSSKQARERLKDLEEKAYTINDYVGKAGIEGMYEEELRGFHGKKYYYSDSQGNFLRELPGSRDPLAGHRFLLTLSAELQSYAEQLLIQNETIRQAKTSIIDYVKQTLQSNKQPWIKGGAIVAMDPQNGEILALASYPRFDPNDFIASGNTETHKDKRSNILRWFESENYLGEIWDQKRPIEREAFDEISHSFYEEQVAMTWENYLHFILPDDSPIKDILKRISNLKNATELQNHVQDLVSLSGQNHLPHILNVLYQGENHVPLKNKPSSAEREALDSNLKIHVQKVNEIKKFLDFFLASLPQNYDKLLVIDLCRMSIQNDYISQDLLKYIGTVSLSDYRNACASMVSITEVVKTMTKDLFHQIDFDRWRKENGKEFLKKKRAEEKATQIYPKPYIDYLDHEESEMFKNFWGNHKWQLILAFVTGDLNKNVLDDEEYPIIEPYYQHFLSWQIELSNGAHRAVKWKKHYYTLKYALKPLPLEWAMEYLQTMRGFHDLNRPLWGRYRHLRTQEKQQLEKHLAAAFYPTYGFGYARSQAFRQAATQGSIFKLVTSYEALMQRYQHLNQTGNSLSKLNPLEMIDTVQKSGNNWYVGQTMDNTPIPQLYKGGRLPRSHTRNIGHLDLMTALEVSSNPYFSLLASDFLHEPQDLAKAARLFSYGAKTGIDLTAEIPGKVPEDLDHNRTGLYALAIGQHSLVVTPLQTAVMLSTIANKGKVLKPKIVKLTAGRTPLRQEDLSSYRPKFKYQDSLGLIGVDFPLFTAANAKNQKTLVKNFPTEIKREVLMPNPIRNLLMEAMRRVLLKTHSDGLGNLARIYQKHPKAMKDYVELKSQLIGKTSTAESLENIDLDATYGTNTYKHVWFGGMSFESDLKPCETPFVFRDHFGKPELIVVVYLRFGGYGKEAAPLAAQVIKKWREIKTKHAKGHSSSAVSSAI